MAKVYEFPMKQEMELPKEIEERLYKIAKDYVEALSDAITELTDEYTYDENEMEEVSKLVTTIFADGILKAVDEIEG